MKFSLSDSSRTFFKTNNFIELEEILSHQDIESLLKQTESLLTKKTNKPSRQLTSNAELWSAGKDLWKEDPSYKKILLKSKIGEIAHFLFKKRPLRLVYTYSFFPGSGQDLPLTKNYPLTEISSVDPILGGVFLCLDSSYTSTLPEALPDLTKQTKGNAIFFSADQPIPFLSLFSQKDFKGILVCFSAQRIRYKLQPLDVHTHLLKKSGYVFGDIIQEEEAPYLYH